jgi:hypothetical protein
VKREGETCPFCRRVISRQNFRPASLASAALNGTLILALSFLCLGAVFIESRVLGHFGFPPTPKTAAFVIPNQKTYRLGEIFPMEIEIVGISRPINAVQADLSFDIERLELVDIGTQNSFANIFIQKEINNEVGYGRLSGGLPNPGFFESKGIFGTAFFRAKSPGLAKVDFLPSSLVLANDGQGNNILKDLVSISYLILPEKITDEEKKLQGAMIEPEVLGESQEVQMRFYESDQSDQVLGLKDSFEKMEEKINPSSWLFTSLEKADRFILGFWGEILH